SWGGEVLATTASGLLSCCGEVTVLTHAKRGRNRPDPL
ncbi:hypothetical protein, partial [Pseudomonas phage vB_Pae_BR141d]